MDEILRVESLGFGYNKNNPVLKNINFNVKKGEFISVVGENGSGKSTLVKVLNGILKNYEGNIFYKDRNILNLKPMDRAREQAVIYQGCNCSFPFNCFEVTAMGLYPHRGGLNRLKKEDIDFIREVMTKTDTLDFAQTPISNLSGGQAQRVLLARALVQKPQLLYLDEAMSGLDISAKIKITDLVCSMKPMTVINIQHDLNMAFRRSDKILALKNGEVYAFDKTEALLNKEFFKEVFNVEVEIDNQNRYFRIV